MHLQLQLFHCQSEPNTRSTPPMDWVYESILTGFLCDRYPVVCPLLQHVKQVQWPLSHVTLDPGRQGGGLHSDTQGARKLWVIGAIIRSKACNNTEQPLTVEAHRWPDITALGSTAIFTFRSSTEHCSTNNISPCPTQPKKHNISYHVTFVIGHHKNLFHNSCFFK